MPEAALIDVWLPRFDFDERHAIDIAASPERVWQVLHELRTGDVPAVSVLMALRLLPTRLLGRLPRTAPVDLPVLEALLKNRFLRLGERPGRELVVGTAGRFWRLAGDRGALLSPEEFARFAEPNSARAAMDFRIEDLGSGRTRLSTETRIEATDAAARRSFGLYWTFVQPGSAWIRWIWLRAVKRRAELPR